MQRLATPEDCRALATRLGRLCPGTFRRWGKMTSAEMLCHLTDSFEVALGGKTASPATGLFQRTIMKWGGLYFPMEWPKGLPTRPEVEQGAGGTPPGNFEADRDRLVAVIERFVAAGPALNGRVHPLFGPMTPAEWQRWGYLHADHHLRQFGA